MKKFFKKLIKLGLLVYGVLFTVFYFDLDGKLLFYVVEPFLVKHYDSVKRKDPLKAVYGMDKPNYEYDVK
ncbi:MAG: hypothetical protein K6B75_06150 [Lachnospiraceae bacterium]|nr:hypothetical protein [Lachnospiraceae bacterium]